MKSIDELQAEADGLLDTAREKLNNCVDKEYLEKRLQEIAKKLENVYQPMQYRLKIVELLVPYAGHDANTLIKETEIVYNYIMNGKENEKA